MKGFLASVLMIVGFAAQGQFVVSPGTSIGASKTDLVIQSIGDVNFGGNTIDFSTTNVDIQLVATTGSPSLSTSSPITVGSISFNSTANYTLAGDWTVLYDIVLDTGLLLVAAPATLLYQGDPLDLASGTHGHKHSYISGPLSIQNTTGKDKIVFPIGNANGFFPAIMDVTDNPRPVLTMECIAADPNSLIQPLPADVPTLFPDHYWQLAVTSGTFSGSGIELVLTGTKNFLIKESPVIIEKETATGKINDLSGKINNNLYVGTRTKVSTSGGIYAIGGSREVPIDIHKLITPNGDSQNENLVIDGIDSYPDNKVTLLDRWGAVYFEIQGFINYTTNDPTQTNFDYTKLNNGNYICVVEYKDKGVSKKQKPQMITVLK